MKTIPSLIALELALALARRAADEELQDPGGRVTARFDQCRDCKGTGRDPKYNFDCGECLGTGALRELVETAD